MNLRLIHAVVILFSAALALLFGIWCLDLGGGRSVVRGVARTGGLRLVVPAQDEGAAMKNPFSPRTIRVLAIAAAVVFGASSSAYACPVCFGAEETHLIDGAKLGIAVLLGVQGAFVGFFLYLRKRAKQIADIDLDTEWSELQGGASRS
jgi:hypothetical protein